MSFHTHPARRQRSYSDCTPVDTHAIQGNHLRASETNALRQENRHGPVAICTQWRLIAPRVKDWIRLHASYIVSYAIAARLRSHISYHKLTAAGQPRQPIIMLSQTIDWSRVVEWIIMICERSCYAIVSDCAPDVCITVALVSDATALFLMLIESTSWILFIAISGNTKVEIYPCLCMPFVEWADLLRGVN
jgi:hypothetical protein